MYKRDVVRNPRQYWAGRISTYVIIRDGRTPCKGGIARKPRFSLVFRRPRLRNCMDVPYNSYTQRRYVRLQEAGKDKANGRLARTVGSPACARCASGGCVRSKVRVAAWRGRFARRRALRRGSRNRVWAPL